MSDHMRSADPMARLPKTRAALAYAQERHAGQLRAEFNRVAAPAAA